LLRSLVAYDDAHLAVDDVEGLVGVVMDMQGRAAAALLDEVGLVEAAGRLRESWPSRASKPADSGAIAGGLRAVFRGRRHRDITCPLHASVLSRPLDLRQC
jgi:hypothetical protein